MGAGRLRRLLEGLHPRRLPRRALPRPGQAPHLPVPPVHVRRPSRRGAGLRASSSAASPAPDPARGRRHLHRRRRLPGTGRAELLEPLAGMTTAKRTEVERVIGWVDERTGAAELTRTVLRKVFPDHWSFLLGEIALFAYVVLVATGVFLTFFFTADTRPVTYDG